MISDSMKGITISFKRLNQMKMELREAVLRKIATAKI